MNAAMNSLYDPCAAAGLARGAAAAYGDEGDMAAWARTQGCAGCEVIRDAASDTLAFVAAAEDRAFVVFRGTRDLRNWITDLDARRVEWRIGNEELGMEVHEGFLRALESVWERVAEAAGRMGAGKRDLFFTGHSLGGALAMLAAAGWQEASGESPDATGKLPVPPKAWMYSFGQPRVGNAGWARWYDERLGTRSFRVVHAQDVVARVPWLLGLYRHAGTEIFHDALGMMHQNWPWWAKAPSDAAGLWLEWRRGKIALLGDHHVSTYVEMLNAECERETILRGHICGSQECGGQGCGGQTYLRRS